VTRTWHHVDHRGEAHKRLAALLSILVNLALVSSELAVYALTRSLAVLADAAHSVNDLVSAVVAYWGIVLASRPPDAGHQYGHAKFENFSSLVELALLALIGLAIVIQVAVQTALGYEPQVPAAAMVIIGITVVVDALMARYLQRVAQTYGSYALEADAFHFSTDLWAKMAAVAGLLGARLGVKWLDPAAALAVAAMMFYVAGRLGLRTSMGLLDAAPSPQVEEQVRRILREEAGDGAFHDLRMRQAGKWVYLDVALDLPDDTPLQEAHDLACRISRRLCQEVAEVRDAVVYVEPYAHHEEDEASAPGPDAR